MNLGSIPLPIIIGTSSGGAVTVAVCLDPISVFRHRVPDIESPVTLGVAFCHPKDQFCRAQGRRLAVRRMSRSLTVVTSSEIFRNGRFAPDKAFEEALWHQWDFIPQWMREDAWQMPARDYAALLWTRSHIRKRQKGVA